MNTQQVSESARIEDKNNAVLVPARFEKAKDIARNVLVVTAAVCAAVGAIYGVGKLMDYRQAQRLGELATDDNLDALVDKGVSVELQIS